MTEVMNLVGINSGVKVDLGFTYCSNNNQDWMDIAILQNWIETNITRIGGI